MKKIRENLGRLLTCLLEILVGILLLIDPEHFTETIIIIVGVLLAMLGIMGLINYFRDPAEEAAKGYRLFKGIVLIGVGLFCAFGSQWFLNTFPLLTILYGLGSLLVGVLKLQWTVDALRIGKRNWLIALIATVLTIGFAVVILCNPFKTMAALWLFIAVTLLIQAAADLVFLIFVRRPAPEKEESED